MSRALYEALIPTAPLRVPDGALAIDTDSFTAEEVAEQILAAYRRLPAAEAR